MLSIFSLICKNYLKFHNWSFLMNINNVNFESLNYRTVKISARVHLRLQRTSPNRPSRVATTSRSRCRASSRSNSRSVLPYNTCQSPHPHTSPANPPRKATATSNPRRYFNKTAATSNLPNRTVSNQRSWNQMDNKTVAIFRSRPHNKMDAVRNKMAKRWWRHLRTTVSAR